ncbi:hypothetical protein E4U53_001503 [Claviceps sorghi]|nr:hypothetical protein E4U53_001503 [Claviceps sorghi]
MSIFGPISLLCWLYASVEALLLTLYTTVLAARAIKTPPKHIQGHPVAGRMVNGSKSRSFS